MGTSGPSSAAERAAALAALAARRRELEAQLASKNEELYRVCVQEVRLTGVVPPEAPLSPPPAPPQPHQPRQRRASLRGAPDRASPEGDDVRDGADRRRPHADGKNSAHRLSAPSISGAPARSAHSRLARRAETGCSNYYPSPPQDRSPETFSMHASHTYPSLSTRQEPTASAERALSAQDPGVVYRQRTTTTDYVNKIYYNSIPEAQNVSRLRETHFSSSHPDITTHHTHTAIAPQPPPQSGNRSTPLLYQYASHLKAQNQHLSSLNHPNHIQTKRRSEIGRRNTLQRTQTYHLTSHSDYNNHLDNMNAHQTPHQHRSQTNVQSERDYFPHVYVPMEKSPSMPNTLHPRERIRSNLNLPLQVSTVDDYPPQDQRSHHNMISPVSQMSGYSQNHDNLSMSKFSPHGSDKFKEKQWYETSLDSPSGSAMRVEPPLPKKSTNIKRTPSLGNTQAYEVMTATAGHHPVLQSPTQNVQSAPATSPRSDVPLESPKNLTVVEQGKWIPYREVTKPFEMSDFYKYSTKFRQANQNLANTLPNQSTNTGYLKSPMELPQYVAQEHWHVQNH